jgi:hypothetical protein
MRTTFCAVAIGLLLCVAPSANAAGQSLIELAQAAPAPGAPAVEPAPPAPAAPATAAPAQKLVGIAAWNQLVGNSITGKEDGETLVEYYAPDGTTKSMTGNEISTGQWALVGEAVCFRYTDPPETECYKVEVTGNFVTYTDEKGTGTRYEILKGNPKGL